jgi:hypothetical protein
MKPSHRALFLLACAAGAAPLPSCAPGSRGATGETSRPEPPPAGTAIVVGTVIDLATGEPAAGVEIAVPGARRVRSDAEGRFEARGVPVGTAGEVRARAEDGREALVRLLPLANERREIVLHLPAR